LKVIKVKINLKKLRKTLGLTQKEFAEAYGFNLETLRKWEQGLYTPDRASRNYSPI
jgi:putative transcriptional regulator